MQPKIKVFSVLILIGLFVTVPNSQGQVLSYSDQLSIGDTFSWLLGVEGTDISPWATGDIISLEIVGDPRTTSFEDHANLFEFKRNENLIDLYLDDAELWFISPTVNGTENPTKNNWIFMIVDDFFFENKPYAVSQNGDLADYGGTMTGEGGAEIDFIGTVNTKYGITIGFRVEFSEGNNGDPSSVLTVDNTQSSVDLGTRVDQLPIPVNSGIIVLGIAAAVFYRRKLFK